MWCKYLLLISVLVLISGAAIGVEKKEQPFSYEDYAAVLKSYVDDTGMVNYKELKAKPERLEAFVLAVNKLAISSYDKWNEKEKIAFWINAYNGFTLKAIIDNYPIKSSFFKSMYYPKNSIRQIAGVWDKKTFKAMGKKYTLEHIEHKILRREFSEPRIHMALVCAAIGCPALRNEPYTSGRLGEQLDDQSRKFLADPMKFKFDSDKKTIHISPIFKWFGEDFIKTETKEKSSTAKTNKEAATIEFVSKYLDKDNSFFSQPKEDFKITYLDYDWSLNEQKMDNKKGKETQG